MVDWIVSLALAGASLLSAVACSSNVQVSGSIAEWGGDLLSCS